MESIGQRLAGIFRIYNCEGGRRRREDQLIRIRARVRTFRIGHVDVMRGALSQGKPPYLRFHWLDWLH